ncbi:MAG: hypothetical protein ABI220_04515 [Candidatus Saccharimonadales bacterium]
MDIKSIFKYGTQIATSVVFRVRPDQFTLVTPDYEWTVHDLLNHQMYELSWASDILAGRTAEEIGYRYDGDLIGDNLVVSWHRIIKRIDRIAERVDLSSIAGLSYGKVSISVYLIELTTDNLLHAWDLAQSIGVKLRFAEPIVRVLYDFAWPKRETLHLSGLFAPPLRVDKSADIQSKLLALFGRSESWQHCVRA